MNTYGITMKCVVYKYVTAECDSIEEVTKEPWTYAIDEHEMDQVDWEIVNVEEIK